MSQHEKGSCDQESVVDNINGVATCVLGCDTEYSRKQDSQVGTGN